MFKIPTKNDRNMGKIRKKAVDDVIYMTSHTPFMSRIPKVTNSDHIGVKNYQETD